MISRDHGEILYAHAVIGPEQRMRSDHLRKIDLADLNRWGATKPGAAGVIRWRLGDQEMGSVGYFTTPDAFHLRYTSGGEAIEARFAFAYTRQPFGGRRRWLACNRCGERCRVIWGGARFACRACWRLTYESQYERFRAAGLARMMRVRERLGGEPGLVHPFPGKPKGMHWRTYVRLRDADAAAEWAFCTALRRLL